MEACHAVRRCTLITKGAVTETLSVSASVSAFKEPVLQKSCHLYNQHGCFAHWQRCRQMCAVHTLYTKCPKHEITICDQQHALGCLMPIK